LKSRPNEKEWVMSTLSYRVPGVSCAHCQQAIEGEVSQVTGVESVEVDLDAKTVTVQGDPLDEVAIVAAIDEAGYEVAA
jgi:copper chaperone CopZ